jgi:hypothetical protein
VALLLGLLCFAATVHAVSNGNTLTITYAVGEEGEEQTAELTKIGDITTYNDWVSQTCTGEVFVTYLPANSVIKSASTNSTESTIRTWWFQKPIEGAAGFQNINNVPIDPAGFLNEDDFNTIKSQKSITDSTFNYIDENESGIKTENVMGTVIRFYPTAKGLRNGVCQDDLIIVQISTEGAATVDKSALLGLIDSVPTSGYHTSNDRWNGKAESANGFWAELQALKAQMQSAYDDETLTQAQVDAKVAQFSEQLTTAKANLIKEQNVNASSLHFTKKSIDSQTWSQDNYSEGSWQVFTEARNVADNLLAELYDENGDPTDNNDAETMQSAVDAANDLLIAAKNDLLEKDVNKVLPRWLTVAAWVLEQEPEEAKYTSASFAAWNAAKEAVAGFVEGGEDEILKSKTKYRNFINSVVNAVTSFYSLEDLSESINVHVRVVDNYGMKYPQYAIKDQRTAAFDDDITLSTSKTLQGLFTEGELDTAPKEKTDYESALVDNDGKISEESFKRPRNQVHSHTYAYINGTLVVSRTANEDAEMATLTHFDIYEGEFQTVTNGVQFVEDHFKLLNTKLSDGDDIVIVRAESPLARYWAQSNGLLCHGAWYIYHYHNFTALSIEGENVIEAKPDEAVSITVSEQEKTADAGEAEAVLAPGVNLFLSDSKDSKADAKASPTLSIISEGDEDDPEPVVTDDEGKVDFSVDKEGWYKLQVAKTAKTLEIYYDTDKTVDGTYPNLAAGNYIFLHITLDDDFNALSEEKNKVEQAISAAEEAEGTAEASEKAALAKAAADAYLEMAESLEAKKDQMTEAHKAEIAEIVQEAKQLVKDTKSAEQIANLNDALKECQDEITGLQDALDALDETYATDNDVAAKIDAAKEAVAAAQKLIDDAQDAKTAEDIAAAVANAKEALESADEATLAAAKAYTDAVKTELEGQIKANKDALDALDDTYATDSDVADKVAAARKAIEDAQKLIDAAQDAKTASDIAAAVSDAREALEAADAATLAAAKAYTDAENAKLAARIQALENEKAAAIADSKETASAEVDKIKSEDYIDSDKEKVAAAVDKAKADIEAAASEKEVAAALAELRSVIESCKTKTEEAEEIASQAKATLEKARTDAIAKVNKYIEDNEKNILTSDMDSVELAVLKAVLIIKDAETEEAITKAADRAIAKIDEKINKAKEIAKAKAQKVKSFKVSVKGTTAIVSWKKNAEVTGYVVYRSTKKKSGFKKVATIKKNTKVKYVNKGLKSGKTYYYKVRTFKTIEGKKYYGAYTTAKTTKKIK